MHQPYIQLVEMNAKHVHSNLALRYFRTQLEAQGVPYKLCTLNINQPSSITLMHLVDHGLPEERLFLFSVYIWNVERLLSLSRAIKEILPKAIIVFGGPEVSFHSESWLHDHPAVDFIVAHEGEGFIEALSEVYHKGNLSPWLNALKGQVCRWPEVPIDRLTIGYTDEELKAFHILYYEASRGCPYRCAFCMSASGVKLRYKALNLVENDLVHFVRYPNKIVKLIDRTFNIPKERALELLNLFQKLDNGTVTFHLEISPEGIDSLFLSKVATLRPGLVQFEVGIQSTNPTTLKSIARVMAKNALDRVKALCALENCHTHVDLIAGLPEDTLETFKGAVDQVLALKPDHLQLGMLKLLHGAPLKDEAVKYGYAYMQETPYEFLSHAQLGYSDKVVLQCIEEGLERLYNTEKWTKSLQWLHERLHTPHSLYEAIGREIFTSELLGLKLSQEQVLDVCLAWVSQNANAWTQDFIGLVVIETWWQDYPMPHPLKKYTRETDALAHDLIRDFITLNVSSPQGVTTKQLAKRYRALRVSDTVVKVAQSIGMIPGPAYVHRQVADESLIYKFTTEKNYYYVPFT